MRDMTIEEKEKFLKPQMGKKPQRKKSLKLQPWCKEFDPTVAKRRKKEKSRRIAAKKNRRKK